MHPLSPFLICAAWITYLAVSGQPYHPSGAESVVVESLDLSEVCDSAAQKILEVKDIKDHVSENAVNVKDPEVCDSTAKKILEVKDIKDSVFENAVNVKDPEVCDSAAKKILEVKDIKDSISENAVNVKDPEVCDSAAKKTLEVKDIKDSVSENAVNVKDPEVIQEPINVASTKWNWKLILLVLLTISAVDHQNMVNAYLDQFKRK